MQRACACLRYISPLHSPQTSPYLPHTDPLSPPLHHLQGGGRGQRRGGVGHGRGSGRGGGGRGGGDQGHGGGGRGGRGGGAGARPPAINTPAAAAPRGPPRGGPCCSAINTPAEAPAPAPGHGTRRWAPRAPPLRTRWPPRRVPYISPRLPTSPNISVSYDGRHATGPCISLYLPASPHISILRPPRSRRFKDTRRRRRRRVQRGCQQRGRADRAAGRQTPRRPSVRSRRASGARPSP